MRDFSHMGPVLGEHMARGEAERIEICRNDPDIAKLGLCFVCMTSLPVCLCVDRCANCGKPFGQHDCQCPGDFKSAFDQKTGERLFPEPVKHPAARAKPRGFLNRLFNFDRS